MVSYMLQWGIYKALCETEKGAAIHFAWVFGKNRAKSQEICVLKEYVSFLINGRKNIQEKGMI